jgi:carboxyl-terminal processing protease
LKISTTDEKHGASFSENDLNGRLSNPNGETDDTDAEAKDTKDSKKLAETDFQLFEALNLLKGLHILNQQNNS